MSGCASDLDAWSPALGARVQAEGRTQFCVWAPHLDALAIQLDSPDERIFPMARDAQGYFRVTLADALPGTRYWLRLPDGSLRADPASRFQPEGVHGSSQVVAPDFAWNDGAWSGLPLAEYLLYELHVGLVTPGGTFDAVIPHLDGLRLDAAHALYDFSARPFLEELAEAVHDAAGRLHREVILIAEDGRGDDRLLRPVEQGGLGLDAQWSDDLHHALHALLTGESVGYYADFGQFAQLVTALRAGFVYAGEYSPFRGRHGSFRPDLPGCRFVVCSQNHDQAGNRLHGERLSALVPFEALKVAAALVLLAPYLPLLFMGEEYAEPAPFLYFTSLEDPALGAAVSAGRRAEFAAFHGAGEAPDPQDPATFERCKLDQALRGVGRHARLQAFYAALIRLRTTLPALRPLDKTRQEVVGFERERVIWLRRWQAGSDVAAVFNLGDAPVTLTLPFPRGRWQPVLYSADARWQADDAAPGADAPTVEDGASASLTLAPQSLAVYVRQPASEEPS